MKKIFIVSIVCIAASLQANAQRYFTKNGFISFYSKAPLENIEAENNQVMSVLNTQTGDLQFSVLIKSFHFEKALMEEHFNENYMESNKFPKATFKGVIADISKVSFDKDGQYPVSVSGDLTMHGVTKKVKANGTVQVKSGKISAESTFFVKLADYQVSIPKLVKDNIAESVEIKVACQYDQKM